MIVVVEGPSAAGKTSWSSRFAPELVVGENRPMRPPPDDPGAAARFWVDHGAGRWHEAEQIERVHGIAVCDTDPLKLHYAWSLWRIGECDETELRPQIAAYREAVATGRIGFADRYVVEIPDADLLARRKAADASRRRRNFELHRRLGAPMREWYEAIEELRPRSVSWAYPDVLPSGGSPLIARFDLTTFDLLLARVNG